MIAPSSFTLAIVMMAVITFGVRYIFFTTLFEIRLHPKVKRLLLFTAPCILTAMLIPIMFQAGLDDTAHSQLFNSSYFWGGVLAIILSMVVRYTLLVIIVSLLGFYIMRYYGLA